MLKIIGYRIINGHTVTHLTKARRFVKGMSGVEQFEAKTADRYNKKNTSPCECWAIFQTV